MPKSHKGHKFILCIIDEVTYYLIIVLLYQAKSKEVGEALIENIITKYCIPDCILRAEHGIKSLLTILTRHLTNLGQMWSRYLSLSTFAYNTFNTPKLENYSPYKLVFGRKPKILLNLETTPHVKVLGSLREYYKLLNK